MMFYIVLIIVLIILWTRYVNKKTDAIEEEYKREYGNPPYHFNILCCTPFEYREYQPISLHYDVNRYGDDAGFDIALYSKEGQKQVETYAYELEPVGFKHYTEPVTLNGFDFQNDVFEIYDVPERKVNYWLSYAEKRGVSLLYRVNERCRAHN